MALPLVLVIDDDLGGARGGRNRQREDFCLAAGLVDVTGDVAVEEVANPIAQAEFLRGQKQVAGRVENDLDGTLGYLREGWREAPRWALVLLDLHFRTGRATESGTAEGRLEDRLPDDYFGLKLLERAGADSRLKDLPVVVLSSMDRDRIERHLSDLGALDFRDKSLLTRVTLSDLLEEHGLLEDELIVGRSLAMLRCLRSARRRSRLGNDNVLVLGETGTGKELLARYIHRTSGREGKYVPLFTQGVPETLIDDRLFGHVRGAYAGAEKASPGAAELAHHGTLFIDEFGDMPVAVQAKLLRLLDKNIRESQRLGASEPKRLDVLVVMATAQSSLMTDGTMRRDLMYRAQVDDALELPPLSERPDDIPKLSLHFLRKCEARFHAEARTITDEALQRLCGSPWPGNVRELERTIERAVFSHRGLRVLSAAHLQLPAPLPPHQVLLHDERVSQRPRVATEVVADGRSLRALWDSMADLPSAEMSPKELSGALESLRDHYAGLALRLLKAALLATSRSTLTHPGGEVFIHPAMKLLTGDPSLTASKAADLIKKVFAASTAVRTEMLRDAVLAEAYETALRLRPRRSRQARSRGSS